jgi:thymidylate synthase
MRPYYYLLQKVLDHGNTITNDRTGTGTLSLFGEHVEFDLRDGFPLLTGKHTPFKLISAELLWFISGSTNNEDLRKLNGSDRSTIWEEWADHKGNLGPIYGKQLRNWGGNICNRLSGIDQIHQLIYGLKSQPHSRRHILSAWNVADLPDEQLSPQENVYANQMALAPCHAFSQFYVRELSIEERKTCSNELLLTSPKYGLSCHLYQRSCDLFLGASFNYASYALLIHILCNLTNMVPDKLHVSYGDSHIYYDHTDQVAELLSRNLDLYPLPTLTIDKKYHSIDDFTMDSFTVNGYQSHPKIYAPISV